MLNNYKSMSDDQKQNMIKKLYETEKKSFQDIADLYGTYANKIRRDAIKFKIKVRDKSSAQKNALNTGKHKHPTKGIQRDEATKTKIGKSIIESWANLSDEKLATRKLKAKNNWEKLSEDERKVILQKANEAVRKSSKEGSKLEKFILSSLLKDGYKVNFHQEQTLSNTKLQIDLLIPSINTAIEIDGPSHFLPVWGDDVLERNIKYDNKKEGLIIGKGLRLIRIQQTKEFSNTRALLVYEKLKNVLTDITNNTTDKKIINIQD